MKRRLINLALLAAMATSACRDDATSSESQDAVTTTTTASARLVAVSKGASAVGQPGCTHSSCAHIVVTLENFGSGTHRVQFFCNDPSCGPNNDDWSPAPGFQDMASGQSAYYYGFPGKEVWAVVDGVESNHLIWS